MSPITTLTNPQRLEKIKKILKALFSKNLSNQNSFFYERTNFFLNEQQKEWSIFNTSEILMF